MTIEEKRSYLQARGCKLQEEKSIYFHGSVLLSELLNVLLPKEAVDSAVIYRGEKDRIAVGWDAPISDEKVEEMYEKQVRREAANKEYSENVLKRLRKKKEELEREMKDTERDLEFSIYVANGRDEELEKYAESKGVPVGEVAKMCNLGASKEDVKSYIDSLVADGSKEVLQAKGE